MTPTNTTITLRVMINFTILALSILITFRVSILRVSWHSCFVNRNSGTEKLVISDSF